MRPDRARAILEDVRDASSFFEIIGEAMRRLTRESPETAHQISEHERIIAFRNILIHGYDLVDDELVWDTIKEKAPALLAEVESLLG